MKQSRRNFIQTISAAGLSLPLINLPLPGNQVQPSKGIQVRLFSKPIDAYDFEFMCECLVRSGISGFDLTVRPAGKVEPERVEKDLPLLVKKAENHSLLTDMMVTGILSADDPFTERVLKTAAYAGIKYYRLGWFSYDLKSGITGTIGRYNIALRKLAEMNRKYNIHGDYQNHSGGMVGGPVWDLKDLLRDVPSEWIGSQYDVRHAMVEGTNTWSLGMRLIANHITTLAIKDFTWMTIDGKPQAVTVPLGEGMVNWDQYFGLVKEFGLKGPITLHVEYPLLAAGEEKLPLERQQDIIVSKLRKDMDFLDRYLKKYGLGV